MNSRMKYALFRVHSRSLFILAWLAFSTGLLAAQATFSAGPLLLHQVKAIYLAPSSDDFALMVGARLKKWTAVEITTKLEEADAILTCQTQSTIVPAKVAVHRTTAEVTLVDRRAQQIIWKAKKSADFDRATLADDIIEQLKKDWKKSANAY
jgi:hypothetical protein